MNTHTHIYVYTRTQTLMLSLSDTSIIHAIMVHTHTLTRTHKHTTQARLACEDIVGPLQQQAELLPRTASVIQVGPLRAPAMSCAPVTCTH
jgi:hypothetical protein